MIKKRWIIIASVVVLLSLGLVWVAVMLINKPPHCIPPPFKVAFPLFSPMGQEDYRHPTIPPGTDWKNESSLPTGFKIKGDNGKPVYAMDKIWIIVSTNESESKLDPSTYFESVAAYDLSKKEWKIYDTLSNNQKAAPSLLFSTKDGSLYGILYDNAPVIISKYNPKKDEFETLSYFNNPDVRIIKGRPLDGLVLEDNDGNLWMYLADIEPSGLYIFNKASARLEYTNLKGLGYINSMVLGNNDLIWMIAYSKKDAKTRLYRLHSKTMELEQENYDVDESNYIYFDNLFNLWLGDQFYLHIDDNGNISTKYEIIRSPVFITDHAFPQSKNLWTRPSNMIQSSNDKYWFTASPGTIMLDLKTEEWCLFTTGLSHIVEDDNNTIWIVIDNILYKKNL